MSDSSNHLSAPVAVSSRSSILSDTLGDTPPQSINNMNSDSDPDSSTQSSIVSLTSSPDRLGQFMTDIPGQNLSAYSDSFNVSNSIAGGDSIADDVESLFQYIARYQPVQFILDVQVRCFLPEYLPSIGDIDACLRIPRPNNESDSLGLTVLDEPIAAQSDPTLLGLKLRAQTKNTQIGQNNNGIIKAVQYDEVNEKIINAWITDIADLHTDCSHASTIIYKHRMPDVETLMQEWEEQVELNLDIVLEGTQVDIDLTLDQHILLVLSVLGIPLYPPKNNETIGNDKGQPSNATIEALHTLFTLYQAFHKSGHFGDDNNLFPGVSDGSLVTL